MVAPGGVGSRSAAGRYRLGVFGRSRMRAGSSRIVGGWWVTVEVSVTPLVVSRYTVALLHG